MDNLMHFDFRGLVVIMMSAILVNNYVLQKFLGICSFLGVSKKLDQATGMLADILTKAAFVSGTERGFAVIDRLAGISCMWHSFFFIIRREDRVVVGSADFKDVPNKDGEVEIGYGLGKEYEHNGYMGY